MKENSYYACERPSRVMTKKLDWIRTTHGLMPDQYIRKLVRGRHSTTKIANDLGVNRDALRRFMYAHRIEPCPSPDYFAAPDHRDNLKLAGRRASPKNNFMVNGRPLVEIMAERGHVPATGIYIRVRRRMGWGWSFEDAYADAIKGPRNAMHGRKIPTNGNPLLC